MVMNISSVFVQVAVVVFFWRYPQLFDQLAEHEFQSALMRLVYCVLCLPFLALAFIVLGYIGWFVIMPWLMLFS